MKTPEHDLQKACLKWFKLQYPQYKNYIFAIPNGGKRTPQGGRYLKDEGLLSGVSDLFLAVPLSPYHGLFIEMKVNPNTPTPEQIEFQKNMRNKFYECSVCYSIDEFMQIIDKYIYF